MRLRLSAAVRLYLLIADFRVDAGGGDRAATIRALLEVSIRGGIVGKLHDQAERRPHPPADHGLGRAQELRAGRQDPSAARPDHRRARVARGIRHWGGTRVIRRAGVGR